MNTKSKIVVTSTVLFVSFLSAPLFAKGSDYSIKAVSNGESKAKISNVSTKIEDDKLIITGKVSRTHRYFPVQSGHIDVVVLDSNGSVVLETTGNYTPKRVNRKTPRASRFVAQLPGVPAKGSVIKMAHHKDKFQHYYKPKHDQNIAK